MKQKRKLGRMSIRGTADARTISTSVAPGGEIVLYQAAGGKVTIDVRLEQETVWLSLNQMARLFARDKSVISRHLQNVFKSGELRRRAVVAENATTAADGKTYRVESQRTASSRGPHRCRSRPARCRKQPEAERTHDPPRLESSPLNKIDRDHAHGITGTKSIGETWLSPSRPL